MRAVSYTHLVVKTFALVVDGEVEHDIVRNLDELEVGVVFNVAKVGVQRVNADVDLTGLERDKAGGLFLDCLLYTSCKNARLRVQKCPLHPGVCLKLLGCRLCQREIRRLFFCSVFCSVCRFL